MSVTTRIGGTLAPVVAHLERTGVAYYVCGSVASSIHGEPRTTLDIDLVADLSPAEARTLAEAVAADLYVDPDAASRAVIERRSFNLIHMRTGLKVDVFPVKDRDYDYRAIERIVRRLVDPTDPASEVAVSSVEDTVLAKLEWYRLGDEVSDRQWNDIIQVLIRHHAQVDRGYMQAWARKLGVSDLLERAWQQAVSAE